ncbi:MAG: DUF1338 family protein [Myxococcota bacterium]|nr:DUF1338 family protein [Myxococcota bacterium]
MSLRRLLTSLLGAEAERLLARVYIAPQLLEATGDAVARATVAQALNLTLLARSMSEVPDLARYMDEKLARGVPFVLDHGAVRSVMNTSTGALPAGQGAFARLLEPLGYVEADQYPLPGLRMMGHAWRHRDHPEDVAQYFVSELDVSAFSPAFQAAVERVVGRSRDPLSSGSVALLERLTEEGCLPMEVVPALITNLVTCFSRHHGPPRLADYEALLAESAEMGWIATEGHTFNHATDRVADVDAVAANQRALGRRIKDEVEVSHAGTVRQTAFEAVTVWRELRAADGMIVQRPVPGSFFEMITRDQLPDGDGLDLRFDSGNAQGIFEMTRR